MLVRVQGAMATAMRREDVILDSCESQSSSVCRVGDEDAGIDEVMAELNDLDFRTVRSHSSSGFECQRDRQR